MDISYWNEEEDTLTLPSRYQISDLLLYTKLLIDIVTTLHLRYAKRNVFLYHLT